MDPLTHGLLGAVAAKSVLGRRLGHAGWLVSGKGKQLDDPLILYLRDIRDLSEVRALPEVRRTVHPGIVGEDGSLFPAGSKTVWPVACGRR
ncbi:MAG: hypothetical protein HZC23_01800 [Rhodocyclales bacterium]|nr:hypothetical protein [Rhodocyclales bacterium]